MIGRQLAQGLCGLANADQAGGELFGHFRPRLTVQPDYCRGAAGLGRLRQELMPVAPLAADRDKQLARPRRASVDADRFDNRRLARR